ncbi:hypothetical protein EJ110_NYTH44396 [Nymphaea thermarum]|nr:hypothetical protein EJ110_NYTH44396 [Nymphaea thermarum]
MLPKEAQLMLIDDIVEELTASFIRWANLESLILNCRSLKSLPAGIRQLPKLKILDVDSDNHILLGDDALPLASTEKLVLENLMILSLDGGPMNVTPSFSNLPWLEKLMLMNCKKLIEVHQSIGSLKKLQILKITRCTMLERLPDSICESRPLKVLISWDA